MRLRSVFISHYKNLNDFSILFEGNAFIDIFVGKNGSGKSNFLEALIEIFDHIYDFKPGEKGPDFDYDIAWEIDETKTSVTWQGKQLSINGKPRKYVYRTPLPSNIIVYYSGQNQTVADLIRRYRTSYRRKVRKATVAESPRFIGIGPDYKSLMLALMLMLPDDARARRFLCEKLGIEVTGGTAGLTLSRPSIAHKTRGYDPFDDDQLFWGTKGIVREFLDRLMACIVGDFTPGSLYRRDADSYRIDINVEKFRITFSDTPADEVFCLFNSLRALGMIEDISVPIRLAADTQVSSRAFSDGQFQSVYLLAISELFKNRNCITLLDEPDAFLHPEWQYEYLQQIHTISAEATKTNHILMSSHSASTIAAKVDSRLRILEVNGNNVEAKHREKADIIKSLSAGLITFSEKEASLSLDFILENTTGPVLFVEGVSDVLILKTAWKKIYPSEECPFEIVQAFDCSYLRNLMKRQPLYESNAGRKFFALFDFDAAYQDWVQLGDSVQSDISKCLTRKKTGYEGYAMLLPVPNGLSIRNQVFNANTGKTYEGDSRLTIELLFRDVPELAAYFVVDSSDKAGWIKFQGAKVHFAETIIPTLGVEHFEVFRPIFDFVRSKI
jgi:predicted ATPase